MIYGENLKNFYYHRNSFILSQKIQDHKKLFNNFLDENNANTFYLYLYLILRIERGQALYIKRSKK